MRFMSFHDIKYVLTYPLTNQLQVVNCNGAFNAWSASPSATESDAPTGVQYIGDRSELGQFFHRLIESQFRKHAT